MRVVVVGPGASGKSTFARHLAAAAAVNCIELDKAFWQKGLEPLSGPAWAELQAELLKGDAWIADGDLGPYDDVAARLSRADTVVMLDFRLRTCILRSLRRSHERLDYWRWLLTWRRRYRPVLLDAIAQHPDLCVFVARRGADLVDITALLLASE